MVHVDLDGITRVCLIHDMGNLIKFDLRQNPSWLEPEGVTYWHKRKVAMIDKYGREEHIATVKIAREIKATPQVMRYLAAFGFKNALKVLDGPNLEAKISHYADYRVGPSGVLSLQSRLDDLKARYAHRADRQIKDRYAAEQLVQAHYDLEKTIFSQSAMKPSDINDEAIAPIVEQLRSFNW